MSSLVCAKLKPQPCTCWDWVPCALIFISIPAPRDKPLGKMRIYDPIKAFCLAKSKLSTRSNCFAWRNGLGMAGNAQRWSGLALGLAGRSSFLPGLADRHCFLLYCSNIPLGNKSKNKAATTKTKNKQTNTKQQQTTQTTNYTKEGTQKTNKQHTKKQTNNTTETRQTQNKTTTRNMQTPK